MKKITQSVLLGAIVVAAIKPAYSQVLFKDLTLGIETVSSGTAQAGSYPEAFTNIGSTMYFAGKDKVAGSPNIGVQLFKTDGTAAGTSMLKVIGSNTGLGNLVFDFFDFNGTTVFVNKSNGGVTELWKTDGTAAGTSLIKSFSASSNPNGNTIHEFCVAGSTLFFAADNGHGNELWKSDGTPAGTSEVIDLYPGSGPSPIGQYPGLYISGGHPRLTTFNNKAYFWGSNGTNLGLYTSDGTAAGTTLVKVINTPGFQFFKEFNNQLFFNDGSGNLWKTDGTAVGTVSTGITGVNSAIIFNGSLYVSGTQLYKTDGTAAGTQTLSNTAGSIHGANSAAFYMRDYSVIPQKFYKSDGTAAGTGPINWRIGMAASFEVINDKMYATHSDTGVVQSYNNSFLWETDGTWAGTTRLISFNAGVHAFTGQLFYQNYDAAHGNEPWVYTVATSTVVNPPTSISVNTEEAGLITLFPNPADEKLNITFKSKETAAGFNLVILNSLGGEVKRLSLDAAENTIDVADLPAGIYFYNITNNNKGTKTGKIIIK